MASTIKVDNIQDSSGNNIINESSNTITIGASGDTTNIVGTLQNNGASVGGVNTPSFSAYIGSDQTGASDNTATLVAFNAELFDAGSKYDNTASNYKFTPAEAGKYFISAFVQIDSANANTINEAQMFIYKNGSAVSQANFDDDNNNGDRVTLSSSLALVCDENDYIQVYAQANVNSGSVTFKQDGYFTAFKIIGA